jgi:hypothetical protein
MIFANYLQYNTRHKCTIDIINPTHNKYIVHYIDMHSLHIIVQHVVFNK